MSIRNPMSPPVCVPLLSDEMTASTMRFTTCVTCGNSSPQSDQCCPYCAVLFIELMKTQDVERELHLGCDWDCMCPDCFVAPKLAEKRRQTTLTLLLIAAVGSLVMTSLVGHRQGVSDQRERSQILIATSGQADRSSPMAVTVGQRDVKEQAR